MLSVLLFSVPLYPTYNENSLLWSAFRTLLLPALSHNLHTKLMPMVLLETAPPSVWDKVREGHLPSSVNLLSLSLKAFGEVAVAFYDLIVTDTNAECSFSADYHDAFLRTSDASVK